jgi:hypothetical protein
MTLTPDIEDGDRDDPETLATEITEHVEIRLEYEAHYDWVAFVPRCESDAGALTKYSGKVAGGDDFKLRAIKAQQRSTRSSSRPFSGIVSNGSTRLDFRTPYLTVFRTASSASTLERYRLSSSSNGIVSPSRSKGIRRTPRTWRR